MGKEIERKFLVNEKLKEVLKTQRHEYCSQSYLSTDKEKVVRIRILGRKGFLTIKSKVEGISRHEFEYEIPIDDAEKMIALFGKNKIEKTRYFIPYKNHLWEVDVFEGENKGLIIAEIELTNENESFVKPTWIAKEVTGEAKYYNSNLQSNPYVSWFK